MKRESKIKAIKNRDKSDNGKFYGAVKSTKIVCHPDCSPKRPLEKNIVLFDTPEEAIENGFRPCKFV